MTNEIATVQLNTGKRMTAIRGATDNSFVKELFDRWPDKVEHVVFNGRKYKRKSK